MTLDEALDIALRLRHGEPDLADCVDTNEVRDLLGAAVDRLIQLPTWEAKFACSILEPLADELYKPQLENAAIA